MSLDFFEGLVISWYNKKFADKEHFSLDSISSEDVAYILWHQDAWMDYIINRFGSASTFFQKFARYLEDRDEVIERHWELQAELAKFLVKSVIEKSE